MGEGGQAVGRDGTVARMATEKIADFIVGTRYEQVPAAAVLEGKKIALDILGNMLVGNDHPVTAKIIAYVEECGGKPEATVVGAGFKTSAAQAAFANGTMAHVDEYGDHGLTWAACPSGPILPATLAVAEKIGASGRQTLEAFVVGWEAGAAMAARTSAKMAARGIDATGGTSTLGAIAAAAKIAGLDRQQTRMALGIGASTAFALTANWGTETKPLYSGRGAGNGVTAALLAQRGINANASILEGPTGFLQVQTAQAWDSESATRDLGRIWRLETESAVKPYPCTGMNHRAIECTLGLRAEHRFTADDVAEVTCYLPAVGKALVATLPTSGIQAKYSVLYCVARALVDGFISFEHFRDAAVADPRVREAWKKVRLVMRDDVEYTMTETHGVRILLNDGRELYREMASSPGFPPNPMTMDDVIAKFRKSAASMLAPADIDRCLALVERLETLPRIGELMELLARKSA